MPKIQVFDPPMCCSTGVCGPEVDPSLVAIPFILLVDRSGKELWRLRG